MYRVLNKRRKIILSACMAAGIVLLCIWAAQMHSVNAKAFHQETKYYSMGEMVQLDGNFYFSGSEDTDGYSIRIDRAEIKDYTEFLKNYDERFWPVYEGDMPKYVCLLHMTVKNDGNEDGYLDATAFALFNGALQIPIDFEVWNLIDEKIGGNTILKLKKDSEAEVTLPFVPQSLDEAMNADEINRRLEDGTFEFFVCDFPVRKLIEVEFTH